MSVTIRYTAAAVLGVVVVALVAACNSATAGQPRPQGTGSTSTVESTEQTTSETKEPDYSLARLCELMSSDEAEEFGGSTEGEKGNALSDGHAICTWKDKTTLIVGFQNGITTAQADAAPNSENTPMTVDGLSALQQKQNGTIVTCEVLVDLPSGRLFGANVVVRSAGEGLYEPCDVAARLANLIVPRVKDQ